MSANERKDAVFEAIRGGAEEYLVKPVTKKEVQNIWQHVWKRLSAAKLLRDQHEVSNRPHSSIQQLDVMDQAAGDYAQICVALLGEVRQGVYDVMLVCTGDVCACMCWCACADTCVFHAARCCSCCHGAG